MGRNNNRRNNTYRKNDGRKRRHQMVSHVVDWREYGKIAMNNLFPGCIIQAHVPFRETTDKSKTRPCVVREVRGRSVLAHPLFTGSSLGRVEILRLNRRSFIQIEPIEIDRYNIVSIQRDEATPEVREILGLPGN